jgi:hypothetical protein
LRLGMLDVPSRDPLFSGRPAMHARPTSSWHFQ